MNLLTVLPIRYKETAMAVDSLVAEYQSYLNRL